MTGRILLACLLPVLLCSQNLTVRPIPPAGVPVPEKDRTELRAGLGRLAAAIETIRGSALAADVLIFHDAVRMALDYDSFFSPEDIVKARELLRQGMTRAEDLQNGRSPWREATGLIVRGYVSDIDRSVQPYGLVVPANYTPGSAGKWRLDCWQHGRQEKIGEVAFLYDRQRSAGEFTPPDTFVLHTYGRYNNASKFAGEVDTFEAIADVERRYKIDRNRISIRGFSMGGASTWHLAAHHAGEWAAAAPGAGFAETPEYAGLMKGPVAPTWWEQKLWHLYNATDYAANLFNTAVIAYSGEIDKQKQAADVMAREMSAEGMRLVHVIGPKTEHRYHPDSKPIISRLVDANAERGRDPWPRRIRFTTWTLRYNRMKWITVDGLDKHWDRARLDAEVVGTNRLVVSASNVREFTVDIGPGAGLLDAAPEISVVINGQTVVTPGAMSDRSYRAAFTKTNNRWAVQTNEGQSVLSKRHGLQGPIDDAFMGSFIFVTPTGTPLVPELAAWYDAEEKRAIREWQLHFRGEPQVRKDTEITDSDIASSSLVLWGDPGSNRVLAKMLPKLPVRWTKESVSLGGTAFGARSHLPILIYPNPLNEKRYVVLNSGFTYREADYMTNAREVPRLPDWAIIDTSTPPDHLRPGRIAAADFFDEGWKLTSSGKH